MNYTITNKAPHIIIEHETNTNNSHPLLCYIFLTEEEYVAINNLIEEFNKVKNPNHYPNLRIYKLLERKNVEEIKQELIEEIENVKRWIRRRKQRSILSKSI